MKAWGLVVSILIAAVIVETEVVVRAQESVARQATLAETIRVQPGFCVELIRSAGPGEGSWISMTFDDHGRILLGRDDQGLIRISLDSSAAAETLQLELRHCRGVLFAYDSLFVSATNSQAIYRLQDRDGDDQFETIVELAKIAYDSRYGHGTNQLVLGPDGLIYVVCGNDTQFAPQVANDSPYRAPQNDWLVPNPHDAGHDDRVGYVLRTDKDGLRWEVVAGGLRNPCDVAFNSAGEMFTYDADMEWDVGLPWYRPTRINHVVSGGEYGWRWGTGKWPEYYEDSLPSTLDTGLGSPTGMTFGYRSAFPSAYRELLFLGDWQNGRILMAQVSPRGASYDADYKVFLEGGPLNVCDLEFGPDGALYFITGGRGSQSGLYRVSAVEEQAQTSEPFSVPDLSQDASIRRELRRRLEQFHRGNHPDAITVAWPYLGSSDRWLRYAARLAVERQPLDEWRMLAIRERNPLTASLAALAWSRMGPPGDQGTLLTLLNGIPDTDDLTQKLAWLRAYQLCFARMGEPTIEQSQQTRQRISSWYPNTDSRVNHLLCELLVFLNDVSVVPKTFDLIAESPSQQTQIRLAQLLVRAPQLWDDDSRRKMFSWLESSRQFRGGHLLPTEIQNLQSDFLMSLDDMTQLQYRRTIEQLQAPTAIHAPNARPMVRNWTVADFEGELATTADTPSVNDVRESLHAGACLNCHRIGGEGGRSGPDLSLVGKRFDARAILASIIEPSKVIDPKYRHTAYEIDNGTIVVGRPVGVSREAITVETDSLSQTRVEVLRASIETSQPAQLSPMPTGLLNTLTKQEVIQLVQYLSQRWRSED